jgi:hypothetical protein
VSELVSLIQRNVVRETVFFLSYRAPYLEHSLIHNSKKEAVRAVLYCISVGDNKSMDNKCMSAYVGQNNSSVPIRLLIES